MAPLLSISRIKVKTDRIQATVCLDTSLSGFTSPELISRVLVDFPYIAQHACKNDKGPTFGSVMNDTSLPHLLEHMAIELQGKALLEAGYESSQTVLVGVTQWSEEDPNQALVSISFVNDVIALNSLKQALELLNSYLRK